MNNKKIFLIASIILILLLILLTNFQKPIATGKIKSISYESSKISLYLINNPTEIIIFTNKILNLKENEEINVYGKKEIYNQQEQIIADKITS